MAQVYVYKIDDYLLRKIRKSNVWKSAPSGEVPLIPVLYLHDPYVILTHN